jgi:hypothetical protein
VAVQVQGARGHVETTGIHHLPGLRCWNVARHPGNRAAGDGEVHHRIDSVPRIDDVSTLQEEFVAGLRPGRPEPSGPEHQTG